MQVGDLLAGRFLLRQELGHSGTGVEYWAEDQEFGHSVALTVTSPAILQDPHACDDFLREAEALAAVRHPNVVTVFDVDEQAEFMTMELIDGSDLGRLLSGPRRLSTIWVAHLADQVAGGLDAVHAEGLVHRDVSPANIMLEGENDVPVLCRFALAESEDVALGPLLYTSPEQVRGEPATPASDIYALGCVLFHCLAGQPPFTGATRRAVGDAHTTSPVSDVGKFAPALPEAVQDVLARCLAKQPRDRFRTAGAAAAALRSALTQPGRLPQPAQPAQPLVRERRLPPAPAGRISRVLVAGCVAIVLAAGITGGVAGVLSVDQAVENDPAVTTTLPAPETELLAMLPPSVYGTACLPSERRTGDLAALLCTSVPGNGADQVLVYRWNEATAMQADFQASYVRNPDFVPGQCATGTGRHSRWQRDGQTVGGLACSTNDQGFATLTWEYDDRSVQLIAVREDGDNAALYQWWNSARGTPLS